ncbi:hypothetical protein BC835DRAFT_1518789 [Cytidiella melzeri]|nr:hypothetical protein BC835DRAFT_1518789 [Cytidiella melzeri]
MPRRSPPSPLRLHKGPLPSRNKPKHTLPSVPRPTFVPLVPAGPGPLPRSRVQESVPLVHFDAPRLSYNQLPILVQPSRESHSRRSSWASDGSTSPTSSVGSGGNLSRRLSVESLDGRQESGLPIRQRGPWDHSSSIKIPFDVSSMLAPPAPVAMNLVL